MPRVKKCPNGTRRKPRKTGVCLKYDGKKKFTRCKNGERKNKRTRSCEKYTKRNPKWKRCPNGSRRTRTGGCKEFDKDNDAKTQETIRYLNQEIKKLKKMVKQKRKTLKKKIVPVVKSPESSNEPIPESSNEPIPETRKERLPELSNVANVPFRARL